MRIPLPTPLAWRPDPPWDEDQETCTREGYLVISTFYKRNWSARAPWPERGSGRSPGHIVCMPRWFRVGYQWCCWMHNERVVQLLSQIERRRNDGSWDRILSKSMTGGPKQYWWLFQRPIKCSDAQLNHRLCSSLSRWVRSIQPWSVEIRRRLEETH